MALFTDQSVSEVADLISYEANLPEVSSAEGIDLETKIRLAQTEVSAHLEAASSRPGNVYYARGAGWQSTGAEVNLSRFELHQVVVTPPLKLWHTFQPGFPFWPWHGHSVHPRCPEYHVFPR